MFYAVSAALVLSVLLPPAAALGAAPAPTAAATARSNCTTQCGNISIPYPFGVEPGCYHPGFDVTCRDGEPPALLLHNISEVFRVRHQFDQRHGGHLRLPSRLVAHRRRRLQCRQLGRRRPRRRRWAIRSVVDKEQARAGRLRRPGPSHDAGHGSHKHLCLLLPAHLHKSHVPGGFRRLLWRGLLQACKAPIPAGLNVYEVQFRQFNASWSGSEATVFIVDKDLLSSYQMDTVQSPALPAVLEWVISDSPCHGNSTSPECRSSNSFCQNSTNFNGGHRCHCSQGFDGNPYLLDGCTDIDECKFPDIYPCFGVCNNTVGGYICKCPPGFVGDASVPKGCSDVDECMHPEEHSCYGNCTNLPGTFLCQCPQGTYGDPSTKEGCVMIKNSLEGSKIALIVSGGFTVLLAALATPFITRKIQKRRVKKMRDKFFKQNHGLLLQQLISQNTDIGERMIITLREIEKATDHFDKTREVGGGGHGVVYKGILNLLVVAIKKSKIVVQREIDDFINEVAILSQVNHRNVVKLLGCCLETEVPLLVYEFISNGTLYQHLHVEGPISLSWDDRLRILLEVARALSYLHSATSMPIYHRDIKSSNILLDYSLTAKVSDFGASRYIPIDQSGVTTAIQGTIGYLDPMYYYTGRLTDKSDVFSFGVLTIELLTRKKPFLYRSDVGDGLVSYFSSLLGERKLVDILDPQVTEEDNGGVKEVATLAVKCTKLKGEDRPTMREVELILENLHVKTLTPSSTTPCNWDHIPVHGPTKETSRQYTMEEEVMLSATYPR